MDRFGFIKRAMHGTRMLNPREMRETYGRELVRVSDASRWKFVNTLFSVSEAVMFAQLVDRLDSGALPTYVLDGQRSYQVSAGHRIPAPISPSLSLALFPSASTPYEQCHHWHTLTQGLYTTPPAYLSHRLCALSISARSHP